MKKLLFILSLFLLVSCQGGKDETMDRNTTRNNENDNIVLRVGNRDSDKTKDNNSVDRKDSMSVSKHLANLAASVPDVKGATAVAIGDFAIVGINVDENLDRSKVGTIKYSVAEVLKDDPYGAKAIVVADPDITARLKEIGEDIQNGKPITGILNELSDIVGRIMPEIPGDLQDPNPEEQMENQKNEIPKKDKGTLDKDQKKQSKNNK